MTVRHPFLFLEEEPHIAYHRIKVSPNVILPICIGTGSVAGYEYLYRSCLYQIMSCLPVKYVEIGAKMNTHTPVTGIGYHRNDATVQERLAPVVKADKKQVFSEFIDNSCIVFKGHESSRDVALSSSCRAERTPQVAEITGFDGYSGREIV